MIKIKDVIKIHKILIKKFDGSEGIRDKQLLDSSINRPYQTFDTKELYSTPVERAAALIESMVKNHPFIDGNKRIGWVLMRLVLMGNGLDIQASEDDKYDL